MEADWIGHILRRNCLLERVIEAKIEGRGRRGIRRKQLLNDLKEKRRYRTLEQKALSRALEEAMGEERVASRGQEIVPVASRVVNPKHDEMLTAVSEELYQLHPKISASRVSVASRVVNPKHDELRPAVC